jgi:hypothetical protein
VPLRLARAIRLRLPERVGLQFSAALLAPRGEIKSRENADCDEEMERGMGLDFLAGGHT